MNPPLNSPIQTPIMPNSVTVEKKKGLSIVIIIVLIVAVVGLAGYIVFLIMNNTKTTNNSVQNTNQTDTQADIEQTTTTPTYITSWLKLDNSIPAVSDSVGTNGRIPLGTAGKADANGPAQPTVIKVGGTYKMWYSGDHTDPATATIITTIMYAESSDGLTWTKKDNSIPDNSDTISTNGRLALGTAGKGDSVKATMPCVILGTDGVYRMWYGGFDGTNWRIYYATSSDGLTWTKLDNSIPDASDTTGTNGRIPLGTTGRADAKDVSAPSVLWDAEAGMYKMWYSTVQVGYILMATSPDGLTWTKVNNQIPEPSNTVSTDGRVAIGKEGSGDNQAVRNPSVIKYKGLYQMWYVAVEGTLTPVNDIHQELFYATSPDGLTWTKYDDSLDYYSKVSNGLVTGGNIIFGQPGSGDEIFLGGVTVLQDGDKLRMFYHASTYDSTRTKSVLTGLYSAIEYP